MMRHQTNTGRQPLPRKQQGMSLWVVLVMVILLVIVGGAALKAMPSYLEYLSINKAIESVSKEKSIRDVRRSFDRISQIDNISSITSKDLEIEPSEDGHSVKFQYEKQIPLAGSVSLLIDYAGAAE